MIIKEPLRSSEECFEKAHEYSKKMFSLALLIFCLKYSQEIFLRLLTVELSSGNFSAQCREMT